MFEVPQRQQLKSIHRLLNVPPVATVKLGNAYQFEKFGTGNSLLRYGRNIRYRKRPPTVRDAFSKAREIADSTDCGQPPGVRDAFSEACRAKSSLLPHRTHLQCAKRPPRSLFAPAAPSLAPSTALGTRNGPARR